MQSTPLPTQYKQELRGRIIKTVMREFQQKGIKAVKMDSIANILSISKRTLYEIFQDKEKLLFEAIREHEQEMQMRMTQSMNKEGSVIDILWEFYKIQVENLQDINPDFFTDMNKYPKVLSYIKEQHAKNNERSQAFFKRGIEEGYFRDNINYSIISRLGGDFMHSIMQNQIYKEYTFLDLFRNFFLIIIRGICTDKGVERLKSME